MSGEPFLSIENATRRFAGLVAVNSVSFRIARGEILSMIEKAGFRILALRMTHLTEAQARAFYAVHQARPFFAGLVKFMTEGPVIVMALEREQAIARLREVMGATNPANAAEGTVRKRFATDIERNCIHGSDAPETAATELAFFFSAGELV